MNIQLGSDISQKQKGPEQLPRPWTSRPRPYGATTNVVLSLIFVYELFTKPRTT